MNLKVLREKYMGFFARTSYIRRYVFAFVIMPLEIVTTLIAPAAIMKLCLPPFWWGITSNATHELLYAGPGLFIGIIVSATIWHLI